MKHFLLVVMSCVFVVSSYAQNSPKKIALIVAVANYPKEGGWSKLSSLNDVAYIKAGLTQQGFLEENITVLTDAKATRKGIVAALDQLISNSKKDDIVVFHFSGHGQQIFDSDIDGRLDESDGFDEALVPYDAWGKYDPTEYTGANHLRDDLLGDKLSAIRKNIGSKGSLLVLIDACHSGTATRSAEFGVVRGTADRFINPNVKTKLGADFGKKASQEQFFSEGLGNELSNMVVISASSAFDVNRETKDAEGKGVGSLSYAFSKAISTLNAESDYRELYEKIRAQIQANFPVQTPMVEGNIHQLVFSGNFKPEEEIVTIQKWIDDGKTFAIAKGSLSNISVNTSFKIYPIAANVETDQPIASGVFTEVNMLQSVGELKEPIAKNAAYKVVIDGENYGDLVTSLFVKSDQLKKNTKVKNQLNNYLNKLPYVKQEAIADMMLEMKDNGNSTQLSLIDKSDKVRWTETIGATDTLSVEGLKALKQKIKANIQLKYLRALNDGGSLAKDVVVEFIPEFPIDSAAFLKDGLVIQPGQKFTLKITNNSRFDLYYSILDLMPDDKVDIFIPPSNMSPEDFFIENKNAGGNKNIVVIENIELDDNTPKGKDFLKFIFTKNPIDLRGVIVRTRSISKGAKDMNSIEKLLDFSFGDEEENSKTRSLSLGNVKVDELGILTKTFTVVPR